MKKYLEILKKCPLFDQIEDESLLKMLNCLGAKVACFDKKYTIFSEGSPARYIGIVLSGSVQVSFVDYYGNRSILSVVGAGEVFGEEFSCAEAESLPVTVSAWEASEIMLIDCTHILHVCENGCGFHQRLIYNLMRTLARKTISLHQRVEITSQRSTREKLLAYLTIQSQKCGNACFEIPFDRQELADYLEVERSGLSAEIGKMTREGLIHTKKNYFELL